MLDEIRTLIRARKAARSSGRAVTHVFDPHNGVKHHHTPPRVSRSGVWRACAGMRWRAYAAACGGARAPACGGACAGACGVARDAPGCGGA
eukprot:3363373-Pleurochrysis_carterae.AAC.1